jgi:outer membrane biosynthesis protein TonB
MAAEKINPIHETNNMSFSGFYCLNIDVHSQPTVSAAVAPDSLINPALDKLEAESSFPGSATGWIKFPNTHLVYPIETVRKNIQGTVSMRFIVEKDESLSNIKAVSSFALLQDACHAEQ